MQTLSSAKRTCMASASAVEWTATVEIPMSWQARWMRSAISPRLAMRIFWNKVARGLFDDHQRLAVFDRLTVRYQNLRQGSALRRLDRVHHLHRLNDQQRVADLHRAADRRERRGAGLGLQIGGADHRRDHRAGMAGRAGGCRRRG